MISKCSFVILKKKKIDEPHGGITVSYVHDILDIK